MSQIGSCTSCYVFIISYVTNKICFTTSRWEGDDKICCKVVVNFNKYGLELNRMEQNASIATMGSTIKVRLIIRCKRLQIASHQPMLPS